MLDKHLAELYGVTTKRLNEAVSRNLDRFPDDFMFQLSPTEHQSLRFQIGTLKRGQHPKYLPRVFTEQGVAMLSSVLRSKSAVQVNILIMRAFVNLRRALASSPSLAARMRQVEERLSGHDAALGDHARMIRAVFDDIRRLMEPVPIRKPRRRRRARLVQVVATLRN